MLGSPTDPAPPTPQTPSADSRVSSCCCPARMGWSHFPQRVRQPRPPVPQLPVCPSRGGYMVALCSPSDMHPVFPQCRPRSMPSRGAGRGTHPLPPLPPPWSPTVVRAQPPRVPGPARNPHRAAPTSTQHPPVRGLKWLQGWGRPWGWRWQDPLGGESSGDGSGVGETPRDGDSPRRMWGPQGVGGGREVLIQLLPSPAPPAVPCVPTPVLNTPWVPPPPADPDHADSSSTSSGEWYENVQGTEACGDPPLGEHTRDPSFSEGSDYDDIQGSDC